MNCDLNDQPSSNAFPIFNINPNSNSYVSFQNSCTNSFDAFLLDTGADISVFKVNFLPPNSFIDSSRISHINGIGSGSIKTLGVVTAVYCFGQISIKHSFQIVDSTFPIPSAGILGLDFFKKFNCTLDFQSNRLVIPRNPRNVLIPIVESPYDDVFLPARCETVRKINFKSDEEYVFIPNQEISENVHIAQSIVHKNDPYVRILNGSFENYLFNNSKIITESLSNYNVYNIATKSKSDSDSSQEILDRLSKNFPSFVSNKLQNLCSEFTDIFALESDKISTNNFYKQSIRLKDQIPTNIKNYRIPHANKPLIDKEVEKLLANDIIEPSFSEYNSPILLVPKKSLPGNPEKRWRLVIDYRQVNKKLVGDNFPLPRIDEILDQLGRAKYFSCLDLISGFHQIELNESSRDVTSFTTDKGIFRFKRLPYGLKIAPNSFQRMMSLAFAGLSPTKAFLYMDDLVVIGCSEKHMINNLRDVFNICRQFNLKLHPDKCNFFKHEVTYLGHKCTNKGILPDDTKFELIRKYPRPNDSDSAHRFVAFCNYYRRFVPNFSEYASPLNRLTRKNVDFVWTEKCEHSFNFLKNALVSSPILQYPDFHKQFCVTTDASDISCGAILSQNYDNTQLPISYASRTFTKGEQNKSVIETELAAIHWAVLYFKPYLYGTKFLVRTDHRPLTYLFSMKNPTPKLMRMRLDLEEFDFEIEYIKGSNNSGADALSRIDFEAIKSIPLHSINKMTTRSDVKKSVPHKISNHEQHIPSLKIYEVNNIREVKKFICLKFIFSDKICVLIQNNRHILNINISQYINNGDFDLGQFLPRLEREVVGISEKSLQLSLNDDLFKWIRIQDFKAIANKCIKHIEIALTPKVIYVQSKVDKDNIIKHYHDNPIFGGHPGVKRLKEKILCNYSWKNMYKDIKNFVKRCKDCQTNKPKNRNVEKMTITPTPQKAFDIVSIDTIGPFVKSNDGNEYAVTIICNLTKYLVAIPVSNKSAKTIAKAIFENFILIYGSMKQLLTDMGTEYLNQVLNEICEFLKISQKHSTAYHHQTLGVVERSHRTFNEYIRSYIDTNRTDWDDWLKYFTYCFNTTPSSVNNYCPFQLVFAKLPPSFDFLSSETIDPVYNLDSYYAELKYRLQISNKRAQSLIEKTKHDRKLNYDKASKPLNVKVDDLVLLENFPRHKFEPMYKGPLKIVNIEDPNCILVNEKGKQITVHKDKLRSYVRNL